MAAITPFLWFNDKAEEAANFHVSIFPNSKIVRVTRYGDTGPGPKEPFRLVQDQDPAKAQRVMKTILQMVKMDIGRLQQAANEA
jgi:hypothetical protein